MTPESWAEVEVLVSEALDVPVSERVAWVERRCGDDRSLRDEVLSLLAFEQRSQDFLETPLLETTPERIGSYRILRKLAVGGSAFVYEAVHEGSEEPIALKVLRGGLFVDERRLQQFHRETRVLARLRHPGIARILEVGRTQDGHQFVAMELVCGQPLDVYVREHHVAQETRLEIFRELCETVEHAHRRGVIHRDLKPSNCVVDAEGRPKLLDFGLARLTGAGARASTLSRPGEILGTLPYLSPEQAAGRTADVDARSDVYALGVVLYQLLTDALPFDLEALSAQEALRTIRSRRPLPPRARRPGLARDLETIVLQAMQRDPAHRYPSARELGEDVGRHLARAPIAAQGPGPLERLRTLTRENKLASAMLATVVVALSVYGVTSSLKNAELRARNEHVVRAEASASSEAARAKLEAGRSRAVLDLLEGAIVAMAEERAAGADVTMGDVLDRVAREVEGGFHDLPLDEAALRHALARSYAALGRYTEVELHLSAYVQLLRANGEAETAKLANAYQGLGDAQANLGRYAEAKEQYEASLALLRTLPEESERLSAVTASLGRVLEDLGRDEEARERAAETLQLTGEPEGVDEIELAAQARWSLGEVNGPEALLREAIEMRRVKDEESVGMARSLADLGVLLAESGRPLEAREPLEEALAILQARLGPTHSETIATRQNLATALVELGSYERARAELQGVLEAWRELGLTGHESYASTLSTLGVVYSELRDLEAAERHLREALEAYRGSGSRRAGWLANHLSNLARVLTETGELDEAEDLVQQAFELRAEHFGDVHPAVARSVGQLGQILFVRGDNEAAADHYREALDILRESLPAGHPEIAFACNDLAAALHAGGHLAEAEELYRSSLEGCRRSLGEQHPSTLLRMQNLGDLLLESGASQASEELLARALELRRDLEGDFVPTTASLSVSLARAREALGRSEEAALLLDGVLATLREDTEWHGHRLASVLLLLGRIRLNLGRPGAALPLLEEASSLAEPGGADAREAQELQTRARRTLESSKATGF